MKKLLTSLLCVVMVVCFMPSMAFAADTTYLGTVEGLPAGITVENGNTANVSVTNSSDVALNFSPSDASIKREPDAWWVGFKITSPAGLAIDQNILYSNDGGKTNKVFLDHIDGTIGDQHYMTFWVPVTAENYLKFKNANQTMNWKYLFYWNGETGTAQTVNISIDPSKVKLQLAGTDVVALRGEHGFTSLQDAINAKETAETVTLIKDVELDQPIDITKDVTIDLGGKTIKGNNVRAFHVKKGTLTLTGNGTVTTVAAATNPIGSTSSVIRVGDNAEAGEAGLAIDSNVTIEAPATYGVTAFGAATNENVTVKGKIHATGKEAALSGNGTDTTTGTNITIEPSAEVTAANDAAIYHPQAGTLTVKGGKIEGSTGIEMKAGTLNVTGNPSIKATGSLAHTANSDGTSTDGYAVAIVENNAYAGSPTANLAGGDYTGKVAILNDNAVTPAPEMAGSIDITGGKYENAEEVKDYVKPGYVVSADGTVTRPYIPTTQTPTIEADENATVTLSDYGTKATIKVADGYELVDVTVNGVSKGKVDTLTGLKTGDKVVVTTKKIETPVDPAAEAARIKAGVENTTLKIYSSKDTGYIKIRWVKSKGFKVDGYELYRGKTKSSMKKYDTTKKTSYKNAKYLKKGNRYYYKVRGYRMVGGEKVYTKWSKTIYRIAI